MITLMKLTHTTIDAVKRVLLAQLRGVGHEGDDDSAESYDDAEVYFPMGLIGRPSTADTDHPEGLQALVFDDGADQVGVLAFVNKLLAVLSPAVEEGEMRLYGLKNQNANVRLRASGEVDINSDAGHNVVFNGGGTSLAKDGDVVNKNVVLGAWISAVEAQLSAAGHPVPTPFAGTAIGTVTGTATDLKAKP